MINTALHNNVKELARRIDELPAKDRSFANSLTGSYFARGSLSDKQAYWVGELLKRIAGEPEQATEKKIEEVFDGKKIKKTLTKALETLKFPKLRYQTDQGFKIVFSIADPDTKWAGTVFINNGKRAEQQVRYGFINSCGEGTLRRESDQSIKSLIRKIAADPAGVAKLQGQQYSYCCFCGLQLTNKSSLHHGYGPICADKWSLPWGDTGDLADEEAAAQAELAHINLVDIGETNGKS